MVLLAHSELKVNACHLCEKLCTTRVVLVLTRSCASQIDIDFLHIHEDKVLPPHKFHRVVGGILIFSLCAFTTVLFNTLALTRLFSGVG